MHIYIINLERDKERKFFIQSQLKQFGCNYEFIHGVLGSAIPKNELKKICDSGKVFRNLCRKLTFSEIGCAISHINIYNKIVNESIPYALILEDDVIIPDTFSEVLIQIEKFLSPNQPNLILLSDANVQDKVIQRFSDFTIQPFKSGYYASSYIITNLAAKILIKDMFPIQDVADCWDRLKKNRIVDIFVIKPALIKQNQEQFGSSTTTDNKNIIQKSFLHIFQYKSWRLFFLIINTVQSVYNRIFNPYKNFYKR